jgi:hypothetical protein
MGLAAPGCASTSRWAKRQWAFGGHVASGQRRRYTKYSPAADLLVVTVYGGFSQWCRVLELPSAAWTGVREVDAEHAAVELRVGSSFRDRHPQGVTV